ncbi:MAG: transporter substrate-binding domain-containing protein [Clostridiaceae bacterium]
MKKKKTSKLLAFLVATTVAFGLVACGKASNTTESKLDSIKKAKKIVLGTSADYPPYEFHKSVDGKDEIVGFDIEIAKEVAKDLGVELEIKDMQFDGLLSALEAGKIDLIISGMTPTEERKQSVDFSKVYYTAVQNVVVRAEDKDKIKTFADLAGKKLGVQKASIQEKLAKDQLPDNQATSLAKIPDIVLALKSNKFDAAIIEGPVATAYTNSDKSVVISDVKIETEDASAAIAVKKGNTDFVDAINKTIDRLLNEKLIEKFVTEANESVE